MHDSVKSRLVKLEKVQNFLPFAIVRYSDGHRERLDFHEIAIAFSERNRAGIVSLEWENPHETAIVFQLLSTPGMWEKLSEERIKNHEQNKRLF